MYALTRIPETKLQPKTNCQSAGLLPVTNLDLACHRHCTTIAMLLTGFSLTLRNLELNHHSFYMVYFSLNLVEHKMKYAVTHKSRQ